MPNYYDINAQQFFNDTIDVDMSSLYQKFLQLISPAGSILDAGCGSGRDAKYFIDNGFQVTAFDASVELCKKAKELINQDVELSTFQTFHSANSFDAIWACASLLHVPKIELQLSFENLIRHLKPSGALYVSFKYGDQERHHNGRNFTDLNETLLENIISKIENTQITQTWITGDKRPGREQEKWLNAIIKVG